jgi:hypothetical protein
MVRSGAPDAQQSLGELVAQATRDISQLIRHEIDLAKSEFRVDIKRIGVAAGLIAFCAMAGCLIVILLCFGYAYLLYWAGVPGGLGGGFAFAALTIALLAALAAFIAYRRLRGMTRMRATIKTVSDDIGMLRRGDSGSSTNEVKALPEQAAH